MKRFVKWVALIMAAMLVLLLLSSCGNGGQTATSGQTQNTEAVPDVSIAPAKDEAVSTTVQPEETGTVGVLTDEQKNSLNMLNYLSFITQEILTKKNSRVYIEQVYSSLINNINPSTVNDYTEAHYDEILDSLHEFEKLLTKRERLQYLFEQNQAQAMRNAIPNPMALLSLTNATNLVSLVSSVAYMAVDELIEYGITATKGHQFVEQFSDEGHCDFIYKQIEAHKEPNQKLKALAFCRDIAHAIRMAQAMEEYYPNGTRYLTGKNSVGERVRAYKDLQDDSSDLQILFTVDILNEGVDIPGVNMVLFLRPTDSQTIFIQQLGRGLRNYEGKKYVTVLDFIGNDYKRSVQIAFALGGLSENFVLEKKLVAALVKEDFQSIGLAEYGVEIHLDDLSKKEILSFIDEVNFNTQKYLKQDYENFKKYISAARYPQHIDYLNNDYAPDLIKFMQSKINNKKNASYLGFLKAIGEKDLPVFSKRQEDFIKYLSEMLPIVRPYEYLIIQALIQHAGKADEDSIIQHTRTNYIHFQEEAYRHALQYMLKTDFFTKVGKEIALKDIDLDIEFSEYTNDLLDYGLGKYDVDFYDEDGKEPFHLWRSYRKSQIQQLLLNNPQDIMLGTKIYDGIVYIYVTIVKATNIKEALKYEDGYIDPNTFRWETVANVRDKELNNLKNSRMAQVFVRKVEDEDGITLPFTYIGSGKMEYIEGSKRAENGAHRFRIAMNATAPEDIFFDYKLQE